MRARHALPLVLLSALVPAAPAAAAPATVTVGDDFFDARTVRVNPGEAVTWNWQGSDHNVRSTAGQTERFRSRIQNTGATFARTFRRRGRFTYFCEVHPDTMRGVVEVGPPPFPDTRLPRISRLRARGTRLGFRLSEASTVSVTVRRRGRVRKRFERELRRGRRSIRVRGLRPGLRYSATLVPTDKAGNRGARARKSFTVPED